MRTCQEQHLRGRVGIGLFHLCNGLLQFRMFEVQFRERARDVAVPKHSLGDAKVVGVLFGVVPHVQIQDVRLVLLFG